MKETTALLLIKEYVVENKWNIAIDPQLFRLWVYGSLEF